MRNPSSVLPGGGLGEAQLQSTNATRRWNGVKDSLPGCYVTFAIGYAKGLVPMDTYGHADSDAGATMQVRILPNSAS